MAAAGDIAWSRQIAGSSRGLIGLWMLAALVALSAHATVGWWAMRERPVQMADDTAAAIMVELAPIPMAPAADQEQIAPDQIDAVESVAVDSYEVTEPVETIETVEPVEAGIVNETPDAVEPEIVEAHSAERPEPVEAETATDVARPVDPEMVEAERVEDIQRAIAVDPAMPVEPLIETEVAAVAVERSEPDEVLEPVVDEAIEPLPETVASVPRPRPEPPARQVQREQPRQQAAPESRQQTRAQAPAEKPAQRAAAPQNSAGSGSSVSPARWQARLMSHLERRKRYPAAARRQRKQGTAEVRFTIDANGNVGAVSITRSSGVSELDAEVLALVRRASPVPAPPPGVGRTIVVPIQFSLR